MTLIEFSENDYYYYYDKKLFPRDPNYDPAKDRTGY